MSNVDKIMKYETTLPVDFNGVFYFTNWTDSEFVGKWGNKEYHYPANSSSPMIIPDHSPIEIQHIRKKFAKDLAEQEFFKSSKYESMRQPEGQLGNRTMSGIHQATPYSLDDLAENIQKCLKPLEVKQAFVKQVETQPLESRMSKDDDGNINTGAIKTDKDLERLAKGELTSMDKRILG